MNQPILLYRSGSVYANETAAWAALDAVTHKKGQPIVAFYTLSSPVSGHHGSSTIGAIFAIGIGDGVGQYKACTSHDDMLIVAQSLNAHITQFNQMFEYDANHNAIKAKLDFYTTDGKSISAGGIGSGSSASLGALYQLVDVMANSSNTGVEGAVEGSVLAYDATAGKWKAIAQSEILPDMSGYYTKDETDSAINTAKSNLQGQVDTLKALIPATASADNQLADKDFVNSSIATATAEFRGSFTSLDELKATSGNLNDYAFYLHNDDVGNKVVDRYKWTTVGWLYEYTLNNSSFTAEQWAAINSTITATLVQSYNSHLTNSTIHITAAERVAWNNKWDYDEETIKAVKVNAAINADKLATARTLWGKPFDGSADVSGDLKDVGNITASGKATIQGDIISGGEVAAIVGEGTPAGVTDYSALTGKPAINGKELVSGENSLTELGIQPAGDYITESSVDTKLGNYATKTFVSNNYAGKAAFNSHTADTNIHITSAERTAWNAKWNYNEDTIKAVKVTSASSADSVAWSGIKDKPTTIAGYGIADAYTSSTIDSKLAEYLPLSGGTISTSSGIGLFINRVTDNPKIGFTKDGAILGFIGFNANSEAIVQSGNGTAYNLLHSGNYNSYAPTLTGTGASGTWGINISGNAATATDATRAGNIIGGLWSEKNTPNLLTTWHDWYSEAEIGYKSYTYGIYSVAYDSTYQFLLGADALTDGLFFRRRNSNGWGDWKVIAFTDSNVASATKLQDNTAFTAWGQTFFENGKPKNVSGDLTNVGIISASGKATIQGDIVCGGEVVAVAGEGTPAGVTDYSALTGKPSINGVTLVSGNNTLAALGIQAAGDYATNSGVTTLLADYAKKTFVSNNYVGKSAFNAHIADTDIHITAEERAAWNAKWTYDEATIKAVKVASASSADSVAWSGISGKPSTFTPSAHTHTASDISGLPTNLSAFTNDVGYITGITKPMVEGVLTGNITSHTHSYIPLADKGLSNGKVPYYVNFPHYQTLVDLGYNEENTKNNDEYYFKGLCKWAIDNFAGQGQIILIGNATPNNAGFCYIQLYSSSGKDATTGLPRYCSGTYITLGRTTNNFGCNNYIWTYGGIFYGNASSSSKWETPRTITLTGSVTGSVSIDGSANVSLATTTNHTHTFASITSKPTTIAGYGITDALTTSNYNSYSPTLTGTGATGTWGISISGNAATATNATSAGNIIGGLWSEKSNPNLLTTWHDWGNKSGIGYSSYSYGIYSVAYDSTYQFLLGADALTDGLFFKRRNSNGWGDWKVIAFTDSNVASATKLATPRTIWGQSFDGSGDVWGEITIKASAGLYHQDSNGNNLAYVGGDLSGGYVHLYNFAYGNSIQLHNDGRVSIPKGNILIGTTTDNGYKLQVNGSERVYGDLIVDGEVSALVA